MRQPFTDRRTIRGYPLTGITRAASGLILPAGCANLSQDTEHGEGVVDRRDGCYRIYTPSNPAGGALVFDGTNNRRVTFPDIAAYDLGTKWGIIVQAKLPAGAPGGTQYMFTRDCSPVTAGKKTWAFSVSTTRRLGFEMNLSDGTSTPLAAAAGSAVAALTTFTAVVARDGATLSMYLDGGPTPVLTRTDLSPLLANFAGAQKAIVGLNSNDNGVANFTGLFDGTIGWVGIWQDYPDVESLLKWSTAGPFADPLDKRIILYASFGYSDETGTVAKDRSYMGNDGTLLPAGLEPTRGSWLGVPPIPTQWAGVFGKPNTGLLQNCLWQAGRFLVAPVRPGSP